MIVPRILSCWYSLRTEECVFPPSTTTSRTAFIPPRVVSALRSVALGDGDRDRLLAAVENAGNQTEAPQAPRFGRAEDGTVLDQQFDALSSHGRGL